MKSRAGHRILIIVAGSLVILPVGCGSAGLYPVTGSVTYQGKPATGAAVHFHREGATGNDVTSFPIGIVDAEGNYRLETRGVGNGAVPGKYTVLVLWAPEPDLNAPPVTKTGGPSPSSKRKDPKSDADRLKFRYFQADKPLLTAEVKPEVNHLNVFELKD
jgi:hypothetical protein